MVFTNSETETEGHISMKTWTWSAVPLMARGWHFRFLHVAAMYACKSERFWRMSVFSRPLVAKTIWIRRDVQFMETKLMII